MKRSDNLVEVRPFSKTWNIRIDSATGALKKSAKGELELRNYMSWLDIEKIHHMELSRESSAKNAKQLSIKCTFYQLQLILFDQTVKFLF